MTKKLLLEAAECLDDCLIRIYPEEFTTQHIEEANARFGRNHGTINRIATIADELRKLANPSVDAKPSPQAAPTGTCKQCGKPVKLGKDGCCNNGHELCFACWEKAGHNCPVCEARYSKAAPIEGIEKGTP